MPVAWICVTTFVHSVALRCPLRCPLPVVRRLPVVWCARENAGILKPWRGRLPWPLAVSSFYHVLSLPLSGLNWRSLFPPWGSGPPFPKVAPRFTGSAHTPLPGSGTHLSQNSSFASSTIFCLLTNLPLVSDCLTGTPQVALPIVSLAGLMGSAHQALRHQPKAYSSRFVRSLAAA